MPKISPQLFQMIKSGNPQQIAMQMLQNNSNGNPMMENILGMINNNDSAGIETIVRNLCSSRGINADELFNEVQNQFR